MLSGLGETVYQDYDITFMICVLSAYNYSTLHHVQLGVTQLISLIEPFDKGYFCCT